MSAVSSLATEPTTDSSQATSIQYSAFGYVLGHLELNAENTKIGKLLLTDGTILPVYLFHQSKLEQISLEKLYAWRIYFRTDREQNLSGLKLVEAIEVKDSSKLEKLLPSYAALDHFRIRARIHNVWKGQISLRLERNNVPPGKEYLPQWKPFYITVLGKLEPRVNKGEAIEITARRFGMQLHLVEANPIDETVVESKTDKKRKKSQSNPEKGSKMEFNPEINQSTEFIAEEAQEIEINSSTVASSAVTSTTATETTQASTQVTATDSTSVITSTTTAETNSETGVIMINGKTPEVTIKFSERPDVPETGKKVTLQVTGDNGIVVRADMNRKTLQKNVEKMDSYEDWIAAMSGKIVKIGPDGTIELEGAGINVFERKMKNKEEESDGSAPQAQV
uniref:Uncharacterized protein n=2 Tax=Gloeothece TaxID=28070 RepID=E0UMF8_GLOV7|nr:hypothetical protein Cyan7822_6348 [Gloeothece verrucosa PCC 7822]